MSSNGDDEDADGCSLTDEGREIVASVVHCYEEVSYDGEYETVDQCQAIAKSDGLDLIGNGVGRDVFAVDSSLLTGDGDCVVKISRNLVGSHETGREVESWERLPDGARRYLTPVLDHGTGWLLMPRAELEPSTREIQEVLSGLGEAGWGCDDANEAHNIGTIDGSPVVIDYGMGCFKVEDEDVGTAGSNV